MWRSWLQQLKTRYRVIAVTIPELEPTLNFSKAHYSFRTYSEWINEFIEKIGVTQCHLLAHSTGACIAAFFASSYPEKTVSITLFSPPDIGQLTKGTTENTFEKARKLDLTNSDQLKKLISDSFFSTPKIPMLLLNQLTKIINSRQKDINFMLSQLSNASSVLLRRLPLINSPTLIIGGKSDIFLSNTETLKYLQHQINGSQLELLENCGHFPFQEQTNISMAIFENFIATTLNNNLAAS